MKIIGFLVFFVCLTISRGEDEEPSEEEVAAGRSAFHYSLVPPVAHYPYVPHPLVVPFVPPPTPQFGVQKKTSSTQALLKQLSETLLSQHLSKMARLAEEGPLTMSRIKEIADDVAEETPTDDVEARNVFDEPSDEDENENEESEDVETEARNGEGLPLDEGKNLPTEISDQPLTEQRMLQFLLEEAEAEEDAEEAEAKDLPEENVEETEASGRSFWLTSQAKSSPVSVKARQVFVVPEKPINSNLNLLKYYLNSEVQSLESHDDLRPYMRPRPSSVIYVVKDEPVYKTRYQNLQPPYFYQPRGRSVNLRTSDTEELAAEAESENPEEEDVHTRFKHEDEIEEPISESEDTEEMAGGDSDYQSVLERFAGKSTKRRH